MKRTPSVKVNRTILKTTKMNPDEEKEKSPEKPQQVGVETPPPPQVIDPSKLPGQGNHETYRKDEKESSKPKKSESASS